MDEPVKRKVLSLTKPDTYATAETEDLKEKEEFVPRTAQPIYKDTPFVPDEKYLTGQNNSPQYIRPADTYRQNRNINTNELFNRIMPPHQQNRNRNLPVSSDDNSGFSRPSLMPFMLCVIIVIFLIFTLEFAYDFPFLIHFIPVLMVALRLIIETKIK